MQRQYLFHDIVTKDGELIGRLRLNIRLFNDAERKSIKYTNEKRLTDTQFVPRFADKEEDFVPDSMENDSISDDTSTDEY